MNKLFPKTQENKQRRLAERRERKRLKKIRDERSGRLNFRLGNVASSEIQRTVSDGGEIVFDRDIDIHDHENRARLVQNCESIRESKHSHIHLNFKRTDLKIFAAGMLLLYVEVYRKVTVENVKIICNYPFPQKAEEVMQHIGFFDMIGKPERISDDRILASDEDVRSWYVVKDTKVHPESVDRFLSQIADIPEKRREQVFGAIKELIANASEHAYLEDDAMRHWVMFGRKDGDELSVVVGDLGRTIPVTIKEHPEYLSATKKLREYGRALPHKFRGDSKLIRFSTKVGEAGTRTREYHRGLGLGLAIQRIRKINGRLSIYSKRGFVGFFPDFANPASENLKSSIQGTIIGIIVPIRGK